MVQDPAAEGAYLPREEGSFKRKWYEMYLRLAYGTWRRELAGFLRARGGSARLLDCGCGPGFLLRLVEGWFGGVRPVGMDLDRLVLRYARGQTTRTKFIRASASGVLPVATASCDVVIALHVLEHLEQPDAFLQDVRRVLAPGGLLMLATPNPIGLGARVMKDRWMGYRDDHISLRPPEAWHKSVEAAGFRVRREGTTGLTGIPLFHHTPLAVFNWVPLLIWGYFPWRQGEAYICMATAT